MHPALSVIFFTVVSGAGYGLFAFTSVFNAIHYDTPLQQSQTLLFCGIALLLITMGLISSTFHLANPKNAWRAFSRFRTSWLAREGVLAVAFYPLAFVYLYLVWQGVQTSTSNAFMFYSVFVALWSIITVFSTGMIYACLKTIRQWHNALTPVNYIGLGVMLGIALFLFLMSMSQPVPQGLLLTAEYAIVLAAVAKIVYFFWIGNPSGPTINTATSFTRSKVRLLDVGHTAGTFLTEEFGYEVARKKLIAIRWLVVLFAFALPMIFIWLSESIILVQIALALAVISAFAGVMLERWLFFAEARHVVNLYHGRQQC
jgi:DMSO reductase anchor subunit